MNEVKYPEKMVKHLGADINNPETREMWYCKYGNKDEGGVKDLNEYVRLSYYRKYGFTEEAKKDTNWMVRLEAYRKLGFTEEALNDPSWEIRIEAYKIFGFTEEASKDENDDIRWLADIWFSI